MMHEVVIVDDNQVNVTLLKFLIEKRPDCRPRCFTDALEAFEWCRMHVPDLVVIDYMMPELDGIAFIRQFRQLEGRGDIPIMMVTANDQTDARHEALRAGANDFLTKPLDKTEFMARSHNMLLLRTHQRDLESRAEWLQNEVDKATADILNREREIVLRLSRAAEFRDPETGSHILRMAYYSRHIGENLGLDPQQSCVLFEAAPMHDIGKVGIPDAILLKQGKLTTPEFEIMKMHAQYGHDILRNSASEVLQAAAQIALSHHEKFDGTGYPNGLKGQAIPLFGRIVAVADVFDALTSERPYKQAWTMERAAEYLMNQAGKHFDPACVQAFFHAWEKVLDIALRFQDDAVLFQGGSV